MAYGNEDPTLVRMEALLLKTAPTILKTAWDYFPGAPKEDNRGRPKWTGFMLVSRYRDGDTTSNFGVLADEQLSFKTADRKIVGLQEAGVRTSIEVRDPPHVWGGAGYSSIAEAADALTGGSEIDDYLTLCAAQRFSGRLSEVDYVTRTILGFPGVRAAIADAEQFGFSADRYLVRRKAIHDYMGEVALGSKIIP